MNINHTRKQLERAKEYLSTEDFDKSEELCHSLCTELNSYPNITDNKEMLIIKGNVLLCLGTCHYKKMDFTVACSVYSQALDVFLLLGEKYLIARSLANIGMTHHYNNNYALGLDFTLKALKLFVELQEMESVARCQSLIARTYWVLADLSNALEYFEKALAIFHQLDNLNQIANVIGDIGLIYQDLKMYDKALEYYNKAFVLYYEIKDKSNEARIKGNIGAVYHNLEIHDTALRYLNESLSMFEELSLENNAIDVLESLGIVYQTVGNFAQAHVYMYRALGISERIHDRAKIATLNGSIGRLLLESEYSVHDITTAEVYLKKSIELNELLGRKQMVYEYLEVLSELYSKTQEWQKAYESQKRFHNVYMQVQSEEAIKQAQMLEHRRKIEESERDRQLKIARHEVTVNLLHKTLPPSIAERLMNGENNIADKFDNVTILFADIVGFTPLSARTTPKRMVELLNNLFTRFDKLTFQYKVERIKTIGDAYMVVAGAPEPCEDHAIRMMDFAFAMNKAMSDFCQEVDEKIQIRIGVNSGTAIGAVVGETKFSYDFWSDAVNTASRMESHGAPGKIHVSDDFKNAIIRTEDVLLRQSIYFIERGEINIKGKGMMNTYFLEKADV